MCEQRDMIFSDEGEMVEICFCGSRDGGTRRGEPGRRLSQGGMEGTERTGHIYEWHRPTLRFPTTHSMEGVKRAREREDEGKQQLRAHLSSFLWRGLSGTRMVQERMQLQEREQVQVQSTSGQWCFGEKSTHPPYGSREWAGLSAICTLTRRHRVV